MSTVSECVPNSQPDCAELLKRIRNLLMQTADVVRPCKACGVQLAFVKTRAGKLAPYTIDGVNHFANCPRAAEFRKPAQQSLIETGGYQEYPE